MPKYNKILDTRCVEMGRVPISREFSSANNVKFPIRCGYICAAP